MIYSSEISIYLFVALFFQHHNHFHFHHHSNQHHDHFHFHRHSNQHCDHFHLHHHHITHHDYNREDLHPFSHCHNHVVLWPHPWWSEYLIFSFSRHSFMASFIASIIRSQAEWTWNNPILFLEVLTYTSHISRVPSSWEFRSQSFSHILPTNIRWLFFFSSHILD